ncbi:Late embryogenesis abundant protein, LEA_2 subgroup [Dillenia turbinata]|uniref:Late embryogenesis abundant protein, LEA_2 subgroup n=1 Tax=Dillenia turbinata TaxID=194707 RepID=A0AAN8W8B2_9MAGN
MLTTEANPSISSQSVAMADKDQEKALAPSTAYRFRSDEDEAISIEISNKQYGRFIKCCGCFAAVFLLLAAISLVLSFTVFIVKEPKINLNNVSVDHLDQINTTFRSGKNLTLTADVSVKNPNVASFKFKNITTTVYYNGAIVGDALGPAGKAKAKRTLRMNVTADIIPTKLSGVQSFDRDVNRGTLNLSSYTKIEGHVKIFFSKHVVVRLNCNFMFSITSNLILSQQCTRHAFG